MPQHWTNISIGKTDFKICTLANTRDKWICVQLFVYGTKSLENFNKLRKLYETSSKLEISEELEWVEKNRKEHHVNYVIPNTNPTNKEDWNNQHSLLINWIGKFSNFFKDKIKML